MIGSSPFIVITHRCTDGEVLYDASERQCYTIADRVAMTTESMSSITLVEGLYTGLSCLCPW